MEPQLEDSLDYQVPDGLPQRSKRHVLIFFNTGNPGLIEYYRHFFTHLANQLDGKYQNTCFHIHGDSLAGFEVNPASAQRPKSSKDLRRLRQPWVRPSRDSLPALPLPLDQQIEDVGYRLYDKVHQIRNQFELQAQPLPVILVGHSVGAYMTLETITAWLRDCESLDESARSFKIVSGICLFPTVVEIAKSPTGRKMALFATASWFPVLVHHLAKLLFLLAPTSMILRLVKLVTKMPPHAAGVTYSFLKSPYGVHAALYMAQQELHQLDQDKWTDTFWGVPEDTIAKREVSRLATDASAYRAPKLYFYWAETDHWIANTTRDMLIAKRGRRADKPGDERKPHMEIGNQGLEHSFCVTDAGSKIMAEKVAEWISEVVKAMD